ncbi:UvrD-helicase domain-containing protein [Sulfurimonas sp. SAG-AH-194-C20]|nr:UvrD-helicase domain-containing protein [Sulfurimonas sp. SAG-AH-194-C20]MDF1878394.1 UvrD-helicase domain-containing protein [Sulfurimonas sp. SAG-AH-194-C20]
MSLNKFTIQKSFAISAGAGSGKTYTLSRRYINALLGFDYFREDYEKQEDYFDALKPAKVNQIVTITYTEAAALEMKGRIFDLVSKIINYEKLWKIEQLKRQDEDYKKDRDFESIAEANEYSASYIEYVRTTLTQAYTESANSKISTIHAYCLDIIKSNADIAKIDTKLDIIKDDEKKKELATIIFKVLNDEENRELILDISQDISMFFINNLIDKYVSNSKFRKDYDSFSRNSIDVNTYKLLICELYPLPEISSELLDEINDAKDADVRVPWFKEYTGNFENFTAVAWNTFTVTTIMKSGKNKGKEKQSALSLGEKTYPKLNKFITLTEKYVDAYSEIDIRKESIFFDKIDKIRELLHMIKSKYDTKLDELGKIDFDTIITKTLEIIPKVKTNYKYIMVDEFQDTNATQFSIVKESCNPDTNLFVVGDSKQSIYSFQGAEIEVFNDATHDTTIFSSIEDMSQNYRSDTVVIENVNKIFDHLLQKESRFKLLSQNYEAEAQDLFSKSKGGSFRYLITSQEFQSKENQKSLEQTNELDTITQFVSEIYNAKRTEYSDISKLVKEKKKAIAIIFDSSTKMLELKQKLREKGITAKVSASDNFYYTTEINDVFNVLKAIDILTRKPEHLSSSQNYYIVGALRSNILRCSDSEIKNYLGSNTISDRLTHYIDIFKTMTLSQAVKYIYDDSNIMGIYAHFEDVEQRVANLYKFLTLCQDYENSNESNLYKFLSLIENAIYFSEAKEDEAFFKSDNTKSIEICSIHSTKGLAYPLVLLANSAKSLYQQIASDALKHNNFTLKGEKKEIVGFKINDYTPLSHRVLKEVDKLKHLAEKKRLLYVALTRAEHDVVISAQLKQTEKGLITLRKDSYLHMICSALEIDKDELYGQQENYCIALNDELSEVSSKTSVNYINHVLKALPFKSSSLISATSNSTTSSVNTTAANRGTITHKIVELYWNSFSDNQDNILDKMFVFDTTQREQIIQSMNMFYQSDIYTLLKSDVEHHFELEFNVDGKTGFIDFIYFDKVKNGWVIVDFKTGIETDAKNKKYQNQLEFYKTVLQQIGYRIVDARLLWLG